MNVPEIEKTLTCFRTWLTNWKDTVQEVTEVKPGVDLQTLAGHFLALRQEINLQTRATRSTIELTKQSLDTTEKALQWQRSQMNELNHAGEEKIKPLIRSIIEALDGLYIGAQQMTIKRDKVAKDWENLLGFMEIDPITIPEFPNIPILSDVVQQVQEDQIVKKKEQEQAVLEAVTQAATQAANAAQAAVQASEAVTQAAKQIQIPASQSLWSRWFGRLFGANKRHSSNNSVSAVNSTTPKMLEPTVRKGGNPQSANSQSAIQTTEPGLPVSEKNRVEKTVNREHAVVNGTEIDPSKKLHDQVNSGELSPSTIPPIAIGQVSPVSPNPDSDRNKISASQPSASQPPILPDWRIVELLQQEMEQRRNWSDQLYNQMFEWNENFQKTKIEHEMTQRDSIQTMEKLIDSLVKGYQISIQRLESVLQKYNVEPIPALGKKFDENEMEVVEIDDNPNETVNYVTKEIRRGYKWNGQIFRYAQVRVKK